MSVSEAILAPFRIPDWQTALLFGVVGALLTAWFTRIALHACDEHDRGWSLGAALAGACCCAAFTYCMLTWKVQETPNVRPSEIWWFWRIGHHVMLISLMLAVTATDLRAYLIPDRLVWIGLVWAVLLAGLSGDLQIEQVWVDWNDEIPQLRGPYLPEWLSQYPHLHGVVWSLVGAACGALGTWIIRAVASLALGQEAMGLGDVTLMAMIGAFLGWQATIVVLILAPVCGLVVSAILIAWRPFLAVLGSIIPALRNTRSARPYVPYGPFLCLAAYVVMMTWRRIWMFELQLSIIPGDLDRARTFAVRRLFGDWVSLLLIAGVTLAALMVVLFLRRVYKNLPVQRRTAALPDDRDTSDRPAVEATAVSESSKSGETDDAPA